MILNAEKQIIATNQAFRKLFNYARPLKHTDPKQVLPGEADKAAGKLHHAISSFPGGNEVQQGYISCSDGGQLKWKIQHLTVNDHKKGLKGTFSKEAEGSDELVSRDETEERQQEFPDLHQIPSTKGDRYAEALKKIIQSSPDSIVISDLQGTITYCNQQTLRMYESENEAQLIGYNVFNLIYHEDRDIAIKYMNRVVNEGTVKNIGYRIQTGQGRLIDIEASVSRLNDASGRAIGFIAISKDVSNRKMAERLLRSNERKFRSIFNRAEDAIFLVNPDGYHQDSNKKAREMTGFGGQAADSLHFTDILAPEYHQKARRIIENLKNDGEGDVYEMEIINRQEQRVSVEITVSPLYDHQDELTSVLAVARDVSDRKHAEELLVQAKQKAEENDRMKSAFLANMSHEIRTPLNGIIGFASMLKRKQVSEEKRQEFLNIINNSANQLLGLINDIIDIAKLESGQQKVNHQTFSLNQMMNETYTLYTPGGRENKIDFACRNGLNDEASYITTDKTKLQQILNNLLTNAFKFTRQGRVTFGYTVEGQQLHFYVEDSGKGIPKAKQDQIFERFSQVDSSNQPNPNQQGTGLGLSISKGLAELLGGEIWVNSQPGEGSKFEFTIPLTQPLSRNTESQKEQQEAKIHSNKTHHVLLVEDDPINAVYIKELMRSLKIEGFHFTLHHLSHGEETIRFCLNHQVDLVLLDLKLPDMNGMEVFRQITAKKPNLPFIAQTAYAMANDREKVLDAGFAGYLAKPITPEKIREKITDTLGHQSA